MAKQDAIFNRIERKRVSFIPKMRQLTNVALWKQVQPVFEDLATNQSLESVLQNVNGLIREDHIKALYNKIYTIVGTSFANDSFRNVKSGQYDYSLKEDIYEMAFDAEMQKIVEMQAALRITGVTQTTKDIVSLNIQRSIEEGLSIPNAAKSMRSKWSDLTKYRSELIARTEIISASNGGSLVGAEATGLPLEKIWLSARDKRTRDDHLMADGQRRKMNEVFVLRDGSRLRYPGDPSGPGHQVIQCRCTQIYAMVGQNVF